jgi:hypothetical protein
MLYVESIKDSPDQFIDQWGSAVLKLQRFNFLNMYALDLQLFCQISKRHSFV